MADGHHSLATGRRRQRRDPQHHRRSLPVPGGDVSEVTLAADGDQTILVLNQPGLPLDQIAAYGAATQVHVEDLAAHLAGRARCDADARMDELLPAYQDLAANVG